MISKSAEETKKIAEKFVQNLIKPKIITLTGELGAGKTSFVQGFAQGLGIEKRILSPTFVFVRSYPLENKPFKIFHHVDLYRAGNLIDAKTTGIEEILEDKEALVAIEWPEVIDSILPRNTVKIEFKKIGENEREITIS